MRSLLTGSPSSAVTPRYTTGPPFPSPTADFLLSSGTENRAKDPASHADLGKRKSLRGEERYVRKRFIPLVVEKPVLAVHVCGVPRGPPAPGRADAGRPLPEAAAAPPAARSGRFCCGTRRRPAASPAPHCLREHPGRTLRGARRGARPNGPS